ncbi:flagellar brake protein [Thermithiobacillus plumbiphilus]|uniref:Flagellar regulator YcgR PilZN domain-containing protein n=1 Tax=Thermithiobacillus plumbiphilus TaxID=1729899 RepID=A0ABU9DAQ4_9PROT
MNFDQLGLFNGDSQNEDFLIKDGAKIRAILQEMSDEKTILSVFVAEDEQTVYSAAILEVDPGRKRFALDELLPATGNARLQVSRRARILARVRGMVTAFEAVLQEAEQDARGLLFQLAIPQWIYQLQRREHFRVSPSQDAPLRVVLQTNSGQILKGDMVDISTGGLGLNFVFTIGDELARGQRLACEFTLPEGTLIRTDLEVCTLTRLQSQSGRILRVGGRFSVLAPAMNAAIQRYVTRRDREILRSSRL